MPRQRRFMHRSSASCGEAALHIPPDDETLFRFASQYEAAPQ